MSILAGQKCKFSAVMLEKNEATRASKSRNSKWMDTNENGSSQAKGNDSWVFITIWENML